MEDTFLFYFLLYLCIRKFTNVVAMQKQLQILVIFFFLGGGRAAVFFTCYMIKLCLYKMPNKKSKYELRGKTQKKQLKRIIKYSFNAASIWDVKYLLDCNLFCFMASECHFTIINRMNYCLYNR